MVARSGAGFAGSLGPVEGGRGDHRTVGEDEQLVADRGRKAIDGRFVFHAAMCQRPERANARSGFRVLGSCMSSHQAPQPDQPIPDPRLGGSERNSERFGDLDVGQTVEVDQFEGASLGVAQLGQRQACSIAVE